MFRTSIEDKSFEIEFSLRQALKKEAVSDLLQNLLIKASLATVYSKEDFIHAIHNLQPTDDEIERAATVLYKWVGNQANKSLLNQTQIFREKNTYGLISLNELPEVIADCLHQQKSIKTKNYKEQIYVWIDVIEKEKHLKLNKKANSKHGLKQAKKQLLKTIIEETQKQLSAKLYVDPSDVEMKLRFALQAFAKASQQNQKRGTSDTAKAINKLLLDFNWQTVDLKQIDEEKKYSKKKTHSNNEIAKKPENVADHRVESMKQQFNEMRKQLAELKNANPYCYQDNRGIWHTQTNTQSLSLMRAEEMLKLLEKQISAKKVDEKKLLDKEDQLNETAKALLATCKEIKVEQQQDDKKAELAQKKWNSQVSIIMEYATSVQNEMPPKEVDRLSQLGDLMDQLNQLLNSTEVDKCKKLGIVRRKIDVIANKNDSQAMHTLVTASCTTFKPAQAAPPLAEKKLENRKPQKI